MFTGIITAMGKLVARKELADGLQLTISAPAPWLADVKVGDSIAHNGICLTVTNKQKARYQVEVSGATLSCVTGLAEENAIFNLEKALRGHDFIGGHLVTGHVDGVGKVLALNEVGESRELIIKAPKALAKYIARKGSVAVDGVSLTVNKIKGRKLSINLIAHTLANTGLHRLESGSLVNLEIDLIARYVERILNDE